MSLWYRPPTPETIQIPNKIMAYENWISKSSITSGVWPRGRATLTDYLFFIPYGTWLVATWFLAESQCFFWSSKNISAPKASRNGPFSLPPRNNASSILISHALKVLITLSWARRHDYDKCYRLHRRISDHGCSCATIIKDMENQVSQRSLARNALDI